MASGWGEGFRLGQSVVGMGVDTYYRSKALRERMKERHDAVDVAAAERHHQLNKEAAEASRQTEQDITKSSQWTREQTETERHNKEMEKIGGIRADKAGGKSSDPHYRFVKDSLDRASKDVSAWMSAHPGMTPPPDLMNHAKAAKKDHDTYGKAMGYDVTDVPDLPEVVPVQKPGLFRQGFNAVEGVFKSSAPIPEAAPGQSWRDYQ